MHFYIFQLKFNEKCIPKKGVGLMHDLGSIFLLLFEIPCAFLDIFFLSQILSFPNSLLPRHFRKCLFHSAHAGIEF